MIEVMAERVGMETQHSKWHWPALRPVVNLKSLFVRYRSQVHLSYAALAILLEITLVVGWALFAGRKLLDFNPAMWPYGNEFALSVRANFLWDNLLRCGPCAFWNGGLNGGYPALIDLQTAPLHPLVSIPTLFFGVVNGAKLTVVLSLALAGFAQWWLARLMGLGRVARIWVALMAVVAGSIGGKMENGLVTLPLSTAAATLVIPAGLYLAQRTGRRAMVILGAVLALAIMSGQGYLQIGMALSIVPALMILYYDHPDQHESPLKRCLQAIGIGLLLSAVFLIPLLHNIAKVAKDTDPYFGSVQPLEYLPLNLVIRNIEFYFGTSLNHLPYPYLYASYIGWVPVLLAALALRLIPREKFRLMFFFLAAIVLVYLSGSMILPKMLFGSIAKDFLIGIRHPSLIAGLAVPFVLGLAAWGLDLALKSGPLVSVNFNNGKLLNLRLSWIILFIPLIWAIMAAYEFSTTWLTVVGLPKETRPILDEIPLKSSEWVQLPSGEMYWSVLTGERGLKLTNTFHPWYLIDREIPGGHIVAERTSPDLALENIYATVDGMALARDEEVHYAAIITGDTDTVVCNAASLGGWIDVQCPPVTGGTLVVKEHNWPGWRAAVDDKPTPMIAGEWLSVRLGEGQHHVRFQYLPWDVPLGLGLSLLGIGLCVYLWRKKA